MTGYVASGGECKVVRSSGRGKREYDEKCRGMFGEHSEFDGVDSCRCMDGYEERGGQCVPAGGARGGAVGGRSKQDKPCFDSYGEGAVWDGEDGCTCDEGYKQVRMLCTGMSINEHTYVRMMVTST
jgi:hypothetical protein